MTWIYLSPHLDDAALSCGGIIAQQTMNGMTVEIWTICAGDPPPGPFSPFAEELHARWQFGREAVARRRQEDLLSCARLSAVPRHLPIPDCIYRQKGQNDLDLATPFQPAPNAEEMRYLYPDQEAIFAALHPLDEELARQLARRLSQMLPPEAEMVCPLTLGGHVDHQLTRMAAEMLDCPLWYYADYPYAVQRPEELAALEASGWQAHHFPLSPAALEAWMQAVAAHQSQISTFWPDLDAMRAAIQAYHDLFQGGILWKMA